MTTTMTMMMTMMTMMMTDTRDPGSARASLGVRVQRVVVFAGAAILLVCGVSLATAATGTGSLTGPTADEISTDLPLASPSPDPVPDPPGGEQPIRLKPLRERPRDAAGAQPEPAEESRAGHAEEDEDDREVVSPPIRDDDDRDDDDAEDHDEEDEEEAEHDD